MDSKNNISKIFFSNKIIKDYSSFAYTCIIKHKKIENNKAIQIFTKIGPIAFLPISNSETSIVFSIVNQQKNITEKEVDNCINHLSRMIDKGKVKTVNKKLVDIDVETICIHGDQANALLFAKTIYNSFKSKILK